jgi:thrombospondin type 3 repeat protein
MSVDRDQDERRLTPRPRGGRRLLRSVIELFTGIAGLAAAVLGLLATAAVITISITVISPPGEPSPDGPPIVQPDPPGEVITEESDGDGDGVPDVEDNCPDNPNPDQEDTNGAGRGDVCDEDDDNDGVLDDAPDNCPKDPNPGQEDTDGDGHGDACDEPEDEHDDEDSNADGPSLEAELPMIGASDPIRKRRTEGRG